MNLVCEHKFRQIQKMPVVHNNTHESIYRSFNILELTKDYLARGVPPIVMLQIIDFLEGEPK